MATGLKPREFTWVIADSLATSERIGGHGFQHRRVRREEEITWLKDAGITTVVSLLPGNQNLASYESAGFSVLHQPLEDASPVRPKTREHGVRRHERPPSTASTWPLIQPAASLARNATAAAISSGRPMRRV